MFFPTVASTPDEMQRNLARARHVLTEVVSHTAGHAEHTYAAFLMEACRRSIRQNAERLYAMRRTDQYGFPLEER